ncbi:MAG TPA: hypothetical protein VN446_05290 [Candidatus Acidoferrum sp.]|nr:hypothetical protein [Candidatus Acidoferrum sp.]
MDTLKAREIVQALADGIDPLTGEVLPGDHLCNQAEVVRALNCLLQNVKDRKNRALPKNAGKPWTAADDELLIKMFDEHSSKRELCGHFKRTEGSITSRLVRLGKIDSAEEFRLRQTNSNTVS